MTEASAPPHPRLTAAMSIGIIAAILVIFPWPALGYDRYAIPKELLLQVVAWLPALALLRHVTAPRDAVDRWILALSVLGALSAALSANPWMGLRSWMMTSAAAVVFWTTRHLTRTHAVAATLRELDPIEGRHQLVSALWGAALLAAVALLAEAHGALPPLSMPGRGPGGLSGNRNFTAHLLATALPLATLGVTAARATRDRIVAALGVAIITAAIIVARSRAAWLGSAAGLGALLTLALWQRKLRLSSIQVAWVAGALVLGAAFSQVPAAAIRWNAANPYEDTLRRMFDYENGTGRGRIEQYARAFKIVRQRPLLGAGPGNWSVAYAQSASQDGPDSNYEPRSPKSVNRSPNSDVFGALAERGWAGVMAAAGAFVALLLRLAATLRAPRPGDDGSFALLGLATAAAALTTGVFDAVLLRPENGLFVAGVMGVSAGACARAPTTQSAPIWKALALAAVVVLGGAGIAQQAARAWAAPQLASNVPDTLARGLALDPGNHVAAALVAAQYERAGNCVEALHHAETAKRWSPVFAFVDAIIDRCSK